MAASFATYSEFRARYPIQFGDDSTWLGNGTYGKVIKVEDQVETEWVAVKICECRNDDAKSLKAEVELAQRVPRHANIARYDACHRLETQMGMCDFAIMKYYREGNLADLLKAHTLTDAEIRQLVQGILEGLKVLHKNRIVHRDFKPANILISRDYAGRLIPKIADFGLSKFVSEVEIDRSDFDLSDGRGTPSYKAPEQITGGRVSFNLDLWAFGVILYEILTGAKIFAGSTQSSEPTQRHDLERRITTVQLPEQLSTLPEPYQTMIRRCLVKDIRQRVRTPEQLLKYLDQPTTQPVPFQDEVRGPGTDEEQTDVYGGLLPGSTEPSEATDVYQPPPPPRPRIPARVSPSVFWVGGIGVLLLMAAGFWYSRGDRPTTTAPEVMTAGSSISSIGGESRDSVSRFSTKIEGGQVKIETDVLTNKEKKPVEKPVVLPAEPPAKKVEEAPKGPTKLQLAQQEYDDLIDQGKRAISSANDKATAMVLFGKAGKLAEATNGVSTEKGEAAYAEYFAKGNRIYANASYQGAEAWFRVAQALRATREVSRKIRDCEINQ